MKTVAMIPARLGSKRVPKKKKTGQKPPIKCGQVLGQRK